MSFVGDADARPVPRAVRQLSLACAARIQHRGSLLPTLVTGNDAHRAAVRRRDGLAGVFTYAALQADANRLSNALQTLGVKRGERVAIVLPQCPETAIAHIAIYQMGAVAMPLSLLFGPDALEYRLQDSEAVVAIVDATALDAIEQVHGRCPGLQHLIVVGESSTNAVWHAWSSLLGRNRDSYSPAITQADDPALLIYTSGTTGPPKGALMPHRALIGNLPGFVASQNWFPQPDDVFWSPADWAWTGGLMDALLPTMYFGFPIVGYRGRFGAERAFELMQRHGVTNAFLFPTALKMMMKSVPEPRTTYQAEAALLDERRGGCRPDGVRLVSRCAWRDSE